MLVEFTKSMFSHNFDASIFLQTIFISVLKEKDVHTIAY